MKKILSEVLGITEWTKNDKVLMIIVILTHISLVTLLFIMYK
jgi:hypothetical protein